MLELMFASRTSGACCEMKVMDVAVESIKSRSSTCSLVGSRSRLATLWPGDPTMEGAEGNACRWSFGELAVANVTTSSPPRRSTESDDLWETCVSCIPAHESLKYHGQQTARLRGSST